MVHIGKKYFVGMNKCELLLNLSTIDEDSRKSILSALPKLENGQKYKSALLTTDGKWVGSTISSEALAQRGICSPFEDAVYFRGAD